MLQSIKIGKSELKRMEYTDLTGKKSVVMSDQNINGFKMTASIAGLDVGGMLIQRHTELEAFARLVAAMWSEAERLKPHIAKSSAGAPPDPAV